MSVLWAALGAAIVLVVLRDMFHTLVHPGARGGLSRRAMHVIWRALRPVSNRFPELLTLAGPLAVLTSIALWAGLLVIGWALIYWPWMPEGYHFGQGLDPASNAGILDAIYLSLVALATLGYGDIAPLADPLRLLSPLEALIGFALLTTGVTWVLLIYTALSRQRALAEQIVTFEAASEGDLARALERVEPSEASRVLSDLQERIVSTRVDLVQFDAIYYFHSREPLHALAPALPRLLTVAEICSGPGYADGVRLAARGLREALVHFAETLAIRFLDVRDASPREVLETYAREHPSGEEDAAGSRERARVRQEV